MTNIQPNAVGYYTRPSRPISTTKSLRCGNLFLTLTLLLIIQLLMHVAIFQH